MSKWMEQTTMGRLHNGILFSRKREGAPTLCNSMDGTGKHYSKRNRPVVERQIPYDLTFNRNLYSRKLTSKQTITKILQLRTGWQRPEGRGERISGEEPKGFVGTIIKDTWTITGVGEWVWKWEGGWEDWVFILGWGEKGREVYLNNNKIRKEKKRSWYWTWEKSQT